jgi:LysM repeat protein
MSETEKRNRRPEESSKLPYISLGVLVFLIAGLLYVGYEYLVDDAADVNDLLNTPLDTTGRELQPIPGSEEMPAAPAASTEPSTADPALVEDQVATATPKPALDEASDEKPASKPITQKPETPKETPKKSEPVSDVGGVEITHTVQAGETFYGIANRYNLNKSTLKGINPQIADESKDVKSGVTKIKVRVQAVHTVGPGDILRVVAAKYGVTVAQLMAANKKTKNISERGEKLIIPFPEKK